ncbi:hypothetical protein RFX70_00280, partial [Acinetobacter baumannii]|nr:hypothetical protein [Acinetobacter baumannii]
FMFGIASFISPLVYTWLIHELAPNVYQAGHNWVVDALAVVTPDKLPWVSLYWVFAVLLLGMLLLVVLVRFPQIELKEE